MSILAIVLSTRTARQTVEGSSLGYMPWLDIFKHDATYATKEITEWAEISID